MRTILLTGGSSKVGIEIIEGAKINDEFKIITILLPLRIIINFSSNIV